MVVWLAFTVDVVVLDKCALQSFFLSTCTLLLNGALPVGGVEVEGVDLPLRRDQDLLSQRPGGDKKTLTSPLPLNPLYHQNKKVREPLAGDNSCWLIPDLAAGLEHPPPSPVEWGDQPRS